MAKNVPDGYYVGRNGRLYPIKRESILDRFTNDPVAAQAYLAAQYNLPSPVTNNKYGPGYEILDPAPSEVRGSSSGIPAPRPRAITAGYNPTLKLLVIEMRDGKFIQYEDVEPEKWEALKGASSTSFFIKSELSAYENGNWSEVKVGALSRTNPQHMQQGLED